MPVTRVLVANRGEVALRIISSARAMGIQTVAVYSSADASSPHVSAADYALPLGTGPSASESYLSIPSLLAAASASHADAVHPGYGFLSESAPFAQAVVDAGFVWIGPSPSAIASMGSKIGAKELILASHTLGGGEGLGVPLIPGFASSGKQSVEELVEEAEKLPLPLLVKASAGGGGKGMRVVREREGVEGAIRSARAEAEASFGCPDLLLETYFESVRHIEFQVLGDLHGHVVHVYERECSVQRRHQKVVEEAPSPNLDPELRARMGASAIAIARAVAYVGAGTVEFILDVESGEYYFLEMNTRLQVEHAVTEQVTGLDLVRLQFDIADGLDLTTLFDAHPWMQDQETVASLGPPPCGASIEVRVYAEDPGAGFMPATGVVDVFAPPSIPEDIRVDSALFSGSEISVYYDPMVAKLTTTGATRVTAIRKMLAALQDMVVVGVTTNLAFLADVIGHPDFAAASPITTAWLEPFAESWVPETGGQNLIPLGVAVTVGAWWLRDTSLARTKLLQHIPSGWGRKYPQAQVVRALDTGEEVEVSYRTVYSEVGASRDVRAGTSVPQTFDVSTPESGSHDVELCEARGPSVDGIFEVLVRIDGMASWYKIVYQPRPSLGERAAEVVVFGGSSVPGGVSLLLVSPYESCSLEMSAPGGGGGGGGGGDPSLVCAPMPCKIIDVCVAVGDVVLRDDVVVVVESMKMQTKVRSVCDLGVVERVGVGVGDVVGQGDVMVELAVDIAPPERSAHSPST